MQRLRKREFTLAREIAHLGSLHCAEKRVWQLCERPVTSDFPLASRIHTSRASSPSAYLYPGKFRALLCKPRAHSAAFPRQCREQASKGDAACHLAQISVHCASALRAHILVSQPAQRPRRYFRQAGFRSRALGAPIITCVHDVPAAFFERVSFDATLGAVRCSLLAPTAARRTQLPSMSHSPQRHSKRCATRSHA